MINLRCTKKLLQHVRQAPEPDEREATSALGDWFGNVVGATRRRRFILFTNERSLLSVVVEPKGDVLTAFRRRVIALLKRLELPPPLIEQETFHLQQLRIAKTNNRRVLGSMNDASLLVEICLFEQGEAVERAEDRLAENLYTMTGYHPPADLLRELLGAPPRAARQRVVALGIERLVPEQDESDGLDLALEPMDDVQAMLLRKPIYQLRIRLVDVEPEVWRRVLVTGNITLGKLHELIQVCMGWENCHLHEFQLTDGRRLGRPDIDAFADVEDERRVKLRGVLPEVGGRLSYLYDFGDDWLHEVTVEAIITPQEAKRTPRCIEGQRACPPEDVGGPLGYVRYLEALADPRHPEHRDLREWRGAFEPAAFDLTELNRKLRQAFPTG